MEWMTIDSFGRTYHVPIFGVDDPPSVVVPPAHDNIVYESVAQLSLEEEKPDVG